MKTRMTELLEACGIDYGHLDKWVAEQSQPCDDLDAWYAANPAPHGPGKAAELTGIIRRRMALTDQYMREQVSDVVKDRIRDALAAEAQRQDEAGTVARHAATAQPGGNPQYVTRALTDEFNKLAAAVEGHRNDSLLRVACNVFEFVKGGHAHHDAVWDQLRRTAAHIGLPPNEVEGTLRSAWNRVGARSVPAPGGYTPDGLRIITAKELL